MRQFRYLGSHASGAMRGQRPEGSNRMEQQEIALSPIPAEAYENYRGRWVAIRDRRVVAADDDYDALAANPKVEQEDVLFHVRPAGILRF
jgi:hypothetical protein